MRSNSALWKASGPTDIPEIITCCDWFIWPRPERPLEGLGIAVIEAQLAGLRLLITAGIPDDRLLKEVVWARLALATGPRRWAQEAMLLADISPPRPVEMHQTLAQLPFDMNFA